MLNPSSDWTEAERLEVIKAKTDGMQNVLHADGQRHRISIAVILAYTQQLYLLACAPAEVLEDNREDLLAPIQKLIDAVTRGI